MPILKRETDIYPDDLLVSPQALSQPWWAMYTMARQEKKLSRELLRQNIPFYAPVIERRYRSPNGRLRTSYEPLFGNYVFVCGDEAARYQAICSGAISRCMPIPLQEELVADLLQIRNLISTSAPPYSGAKISFGVWSPKPVFGFHSCPGAR